MLTTQLSIYILSKTTLIFGQIVCAQCPAIVFILNYQAFQSTHTKHPPWTAYSKKAFNTHRQKTKWGKLRRLKGWEVPQQHQSRCQSCSLVVPSLFGLKSRSAHVCCDPDAEREQKTQWANRKEATLSVQTTFTPRATEKYLVFPKP